MTILLVRTLGKYGPQIYQSQGESGLCVYNKDMYVALQFFDHPVIIDFLKDSWYGRRYKTNYQDDGGFSFPSAVYSMFSFSRLYFSSPWL